MERLLVSLERRFGRFAIPNLIGYVVGGMALVFALSTLKPEFQEHLVLDFGAIRHGEVWRLVTFLFIPPPSSPFWLMVNLYFTWWVGSSLEENWGPFKFNTYYFTGALGVIVAGLFAGPVTNTWLDASLFLAFATMFPDVTILLFFIIPVRVKWLGMLAAVAAVAAAVLGGWGTRAGIIASFANYALFFTGYWRDAGKQRSLIGRQRSRLESLRAGRPSSAPSSAPSNRPSNRPVAAPGPDESAEPTYGARVCAMCGAREADGTDIRVCSCEKCGGKPRTLCLAHARAH